MKLAQSRTIHLKRLRFANFSKVNLNVNQIFLKIEGKMLHSNPALHFSIKVCHQLIAPSYTP